MAGYWPPLLLSSQTGTRKIIKFYACWLLCWVLLTDDFNFYHETTVTEQTLQTGPAFTACQAATNLELRENVVVTTLLLPQPPAFTDNISCSSIVTEEFQ